MTLKQLSSEQLNSSVIENITCFDAHSTCNVTCKRENCRYWVDHKNSCNCVLVATKKNGSHTLQTIGEIYGLTRMRICQIEKEAKAKILQSIK